MEVLAPVLRSFTEPQALESVTVGEPRAGEVRVRMVAAGVCHSCLAVEQGLYPDMPLPMILGDEGAGVVDTVGPGCTLSPGDHVILSWAPSCETCLMCAKRRPALCENSSPFHMSDGTSRYSVGDEPVMHFGSSTYSPYVVVAENMAVRITSRIPLDQAALIGCSVTTGIGAVLNATNVRPGDSVAVFGCGGVGLNAVQGAVLAGAGQVIAVDVVDAKLEAAFKFGATAGVNAGDGNTVDEIRTIARRGVDHAIVAVGSGQVTEQALQSLAPTGTCVLVGASPPGRSISVDPGLILGGERRLVGSKYGTSDPHTAFPKLIDLYLIGKLKLEELISTRYRLDQINTASAALASGQELRGVILFSEDDV